MPVTVTFNDDLFLINVRAAIAFQGDQEYVLSVEKRRDDKAEASGLLILSRELVGLLHDAGGNLTEATPTKTVHKVRKDLRSVPSHRRPRKRAVRGDGELQG